MTKGATAAEGGGQQNRTSRTAPREPRPALPCPTVHPLHLLPVGRTRGTSQPPPSWTLPTPSSSSARHLQQLTLVIPHKTHPTLRHRQKDRLHPLHDASLAPKADHKGKHAGRRPSLIRSFAPRDKTHSNQGHAN